MAKFQTLNITDEERHAMTNGIFNAITHDLPERIREDNLPTTVGSGLWRWNYINKNITENLGNSFQVHYAQRGPWKALILYDKKTELTFSVMSEKNLDILQRKFIRGKLETIHYIESLVSKNIGYSVIEGQMRLDSYEMPNRDKGAIEKLREQLLNEFAGIIKNHILILFDYAFNKVLSVRAVLLTPNLEIAFSEEWSKFLDKSFIRNSEFIEELVDEKPLVSIKTTPEILVSIPEVSDVSGV